MNELLRNYFFVRLALPKFALLLIFTLISLSGCERQLTQAADSEMNFKQIPLQLSLPWVNPMQTQEQVQKTGPFGLLIRALEVFDWAAMIAYRQLAGLLQRVGALMPVIGGLRRMG